HHGENNDDGTVFMGSSNLTYQGLISQGELNEEYNDREHYQEYFGKFKALWEKSQNIDVVTQVTKDEFIRIVEYDKKFSTDGIRFIGLKGIGQAQVFDHITSESLWEYVLAYMQTDGLIQVS
ncbi:MAG: hypothetical protein HQ517_06935, partial [SAR324 cluster bacterium]|nr:hypothetical protein [SAR324 cluster bacterium]